ncbi:hypothetical protein G8C92_11895 [Paenibacillus donghaensis]|uniref:hypothetical protein n=1 Tax=Paenibacillus donghaensis TaxID=414771 RepID=UPI001883D89C|nr:hypothetical protein [Paenibacillus donghaensis]MBE9914736.1 hypothetical protein [Paenibacillus donghaensis]
MAAPRTPHFDNNELASDCFIMEILIFFMFFNFFCNFFNFDVFYKVDSLKYPIHKGGNRVGCIIFANKPILEGIKLKQKLMKIFMLAICLFAVMIPTSVGAQEAEDNSDHVVNNDFSAPREITPEKLAYLNSVTTIAIPVKESQVTIDSNVAALAAKMSYTIDYLSPYNEMRSKSSFRTSNGYATLSLVQWSKGFGDPEVVYSIVDSSGKSYGSQVLKGTYTSSNITIGFNNLPTNIDLYVEIFNRHDYAMAGNGYIN